MKDSGLSREYGLIAAPMMSAISSGTIAGPPSRGRPAPSRIRPTRSLLTGRRNTSPRNLTPVCRSTEDVPSKTCTITWSSEVSRTCPFFMVPSVSLNCTISPYATGSVLFRNTKGPLTSVMVRYSFPLIHIPPQFSSMVAAICLPISFTSFSIRSSYPSSNLPRMMSVLA